MLPKSEYVGGIPIILRLAPQDVITPRQPAPIAFVLPRTTLLIAILRDALEVFSPYAAALHQHRTQVWFSYQGQVVQWTYPVGPIKDYVVGLKAANSDDGKSIDSSSSVVAAEPLQLEFRIHQPSSAKTLQKDAPFFVNYERLDDYVRNEVKQAHKASYTAMYGAYKYYQNKSEATLRPALGVALYRPFEAASGRDGGAAAAVATPDTMQHLTPSSPLLATATPEGGGGSTIVVVPQRSGSDNQFTSPYLLPEYHSLLQSVFADPPASYLVQFGFPAAASSAAGRSASQWFSSARVSAAPWRPHAGATTTAAPALPEEGHDEEDGNLISTEIPLGLLLWRLFMRPCLRFMQEQEKQNENPNAAFNTTNTTTSGTVSADDLWRAVSPWYANAPEDVLSAVDAHEALQSCAKSLLPWASWESDMTERFIDAYEGGRGGRGFSLHGGATHNAQRRLVLEVQGVEPSLRTPVRFLDSYMASSDRCVYVVVKVC